MDAATYQPLLLTRPSFSGVALDVAFTRDGQLVSNGTDGRIVSWDVRHPTRTQAELDHLVRCRVPYQLVGDDVLPRALDPGCD